MNPNSRIDTLKAIHASIWFFGLWHAFVLLGILVAVLTRG